jgi:hypothetical protein
MKPIASHIRTKDASATLVLLTSLSIAFALLIYMAIGFFRLSSDARALRNSLTGHQDSGWARRIELNVGPLTTALARAGTRYLELDDEPRLALQALRGVEVGIYQARGSHETTDSAELLTAADTAMLGRGWRRVVGVSSSGNLVAVYMPERKINPRDAKLCVAVLSEGNLVVVSARSNLEPLVELALKASGGKATQWLNAGL